MWVPWCCSKSSSARLAADRRAEFAEMPEKKVKNVIKKIVNNCTNESHRKDLNKDSNLIL